VKQSNDFDSVVNVDAATDGWFLAYTKPRQEQVALQNLAQQGFDVYLPMYKKFKASEQGQVSLFEVMFPRYIFFRPGQVGQSMGTARSTKGVATVIRFGVDFARLQDVLVRQIRVMEEERNQATHLDLSSLKPGQRVRLQHTALSGMEGLVQTVSSKRVAVLLEILGRPTVVDLKHHQVETN
jgi:transcriptional antiterminator RfaH